MSKIDKVKQCLFQIIFFGGFMNYSQIFLSLINNGFFYSRIIQLMSMYYFLENKWKFFKCKTVYK